MFPSVKWAIILASSLILNSCVSSIPLMQSVKKFAEGFDRPAGLAFDEMGNLYVVNLNTGLILRVSRGGVMDTFAFGPVGAAGIAIGPSGYVYVSYYQDGTVKRVPSTGGTMRTYARHFSNPAGICFDASGNLFVANHNNNTVTEISQDGVESIFASGFFGPVGLAFDKAGNLYVANRTSNSISKVTPDGTVSVYASGIPTPHSLAFDKNGNLFVSEADGYHGKTITVITRAGFIYQLTNIYFQPTGLAFDAAGALYVSNIDSGYVSRIVLQP